MNRVEIFQHYSTFDRIFDIYRPGLDGDGDADDGDGDDDGDADDGDDDGSEQ